MTTKLFFRDLIQSLTQTGVSPNLPAGRRKVIEQTNALTLTAALMSFPYIGIFYWSKSYLLALLAVFVVLGFIAVPIFNKFSFNNFSRFLMIAVGNLAVTGYSITLGRQAGIHLYYLVLIAYPFLAFEPTEKIKILFSLSLPLVFYGILEGKYFTEAPWIILNPSQLNIIGYSIFVSCFLTLIAAFVFFTHTNQESEIQLKRSLSKLNSLFDNVSDTVYLIDRNLRIKLINKGVIQYDVKPENVEYKSIYELLPKHEAEVYAGYYQEVFNSGKIKRVHDRFTKLNGEIVWHSLVLSPLFGRNGQPEELLAISRDMTAENEVHEKLKLAKTEAENSNRMKDEFLAILSHELRTPLTTILAWTQMLRSGMLNKEKTKRGFVILEQSVKAQGQLINDLLDVSRIHSGKLFLELKEIDPVDPILKALEAVQIIAESKSIQINLTNHTSDVRVLADTVRLQQVFWNLLVNAIKFTQQDGKIEITVDRMNHLKQEQLRIQVRDNGKGILPEFLPYLFKRFSQADNSSTRLNSGLGLGLALVRNLTEMQGGTAQGESDGPNRGATFTVNLPLISSSVNSAHSQSLEKLQEEEPVKLNGIRLLTVDDDENASEAISLLLKSLGAEVISVASVSEAWAKLKHFRPDVLLTDIAMPYEDGYDLVRKIRGDEKTTLGPHLPILVLTTYAGNEDIQNILAEGFNAHIAKPVNAADVSRIITQLVAQAKRAAAIGAGIQPKPEAV
jgi:PAS domain S-box-containing protein